MKKNSSEKEILDNMRLVVPSLVSMIVGQKAGAFSVTTEDLEKIFAGILVSMKPEDMAPVGLSRSEKRNILSSASSKQDGLLEIASMETAISKEIGSSLGSMEKIGLVTKGKDGEAWSITEKGVAFFLGDMLKHHEIPKHAQVDIDKEARRVSESKAAMMFLFRLAALQPIPGEEEPVLTASLIPQVKRSLPLSQEDLAGLKNRKDKKIDQVVRNIVSHKTLETPGYVVRKKSENSRKTGYVITQAGRLKIAQLLADLILPEDVFEVLLESPIEGVRVKACSKLAKKMEDQMVEDYLQKFPEEREAFEEFRRQAKLHAEKGDLDEWAKIHSFDKLKERSFKEVMGFDKSESERVNTKRSARKRSIL